MSEWKVQAKQHFANRRSPEMLREIPVKEWGISVYYWPAISNAEDRAIKLGFQPGSKIEGDGVRAIRVDAIGGHVTELIARARDQHGRRLFADGEFDDVLNHYDPAVIERIVTEMETEYTSAEDAAKN
jgi:hypothetical protein